MHKYKVTLATWDMVEVEADSMSESSSGALEFYAFNETALRISPALVRTFHKDHWMQAERLPDEVEASATLPTAESFPITAGDIDQIGKLAEAMLTTGGGAFHEENEFGPED